MSRFSTVVTVRRDNEKSNDQEHLIERLGNLYRLGCRIYRFNVGKWDESEFDDLKSDIDRFREMFTDVKIMIDLPYPGKKARISTINREELYLNLDDQLTILSSASALSVERDKNVVFITTKSIGDRLNVNEQIVYGDGEGTLSVTKVVGSDKIIAIAENEFSISHTKSLSFEGSIDENSKNYNQITKLVNHICPDIIALSFVEYGKQIREIKEKLTNKKIEIMPKIETRKGYLNIDEILVEVDSIMLGRGDLGLRVSTRELAEIQYGLVKKVNQKNKNIFIATDILSSMERQIIPTRADALDLDIIMRSNVSGIVLTYGLVRSKNISRAIKIVNDYLIEGEVLWS